MLERLKKFAEIEVLIAIASGVFGLLISPLLDKITSPLFDTPTRALLTGLFLLALLAIASVITTGIFARRYERINSKVKDELSSINQRLGLTVRFVHDPPKRSTGEVYRTAREIIEKAEKEILVLYFSRSRNREERERGRDIETEEYRNERERYTQAMLEKLRQHKTKRLFYRRVFQFPEGRDIKFIEDRVGQRWTTHTKGVLEILDEYPDAGYIKKAPLFLEQTYVIVDRRYVIWGIDGIDPEHEVRYMEGALFFDDPNQEFIQYLIGFFQRVDAHAVIVRKMPEA
jgi:hypothetical protein